MQAMSAQSSASLTMLEHAGLTGMIYSGDHDTVVPHTGTEAWLASLDLTAVSPWSPWFYPDAAMGSPQVGLTHQSAPSPWQTCVHLLQPHLIVLLAESQSRHAQRTAFKLLKSHLCFQY